VSVQSEIERLKDKLGSVINEAEATIADAQYAHDDLQKSFAAEVEVLLERNAVLEEENKSLHALLTKSSGDVEIERGLLLRSVKIIERLRLRGKDLSRNVDRKVLFHELRRLNVQQGMGSPRGTSNQQFQARVGQQKSARRISIMLPR
jgi:hypothetical protein